jgi:hypothetical protein
MQPMNKQSDQIIQKEYELLYNQLFDLFFSTHKIRFSLGHLLERSKGSMNDCISSVLKLITTEPVHLNFTEDGFCPFKNEPFLVIPYDKMSSMQLVLIQEIIRHCKTSKNYMACSRMGVGSSVFMLETSGSDRPLDVAVVLFGLYQLISMSSQNRKQQVDVYNIMTQRLMKSVLIPPESLLEAQSLCDEFDMEQKKQ